MMRSRVDLPLPEGPSRQTVSPSATLKEMPRRYWKNMPETALVPGLIAGAQARESAMVVASRENLDGNIAGSWEALREEAMGCTRCPLYKDATARNFKPTSRSHPRSGFQSLLICSIEWTYNLGQVQAADMQIDGCRCR